MRIYPDTNIWNALCKQGVDPKTLVESLAAKGATLVLSPHTVYELARTFAGNKPTAAAQGTQLFSCLKRYLDLHVEYTKEVMELLAAEAYVFENGLPQIDPMLSEEGCSTVRQEVEKLANGIVEGRVKEFIDKRTQLAKTTRTEQKDHFVGRQDMKIKLQAVAESQLDQWLRLQTITPSGAEVLYSHLERMFGKGPTPAYALSMLLSLVGKAAGGLVRADLYYNWRCANRGSNPADLMDDMLHVLQATYCDVYATADPDQSKYAQMLLTSATRVAIYDYKTPIDQWLISLV